MKVWGLEAALRVRQRHTADVVADIHMPKSGTESVTSNIRKAMLVYPDITMSSKLSGCTVTAAAPQSQGCIIIFQGTGFWARAAFPFEQGSTAPLAPPSRAPHSQISVV